MVEGIPSSRYWLCLSGTHSIQSGALYLAKRARPRREFRPMTEIVNEKKVQSISTYRKAGIQYSITSMSNYRLLEYAVKV
jgi:hypothetical protein